MDLILKTFRYRLIIFFAFHIIHFKIRDGFVYVEKFKHQISNCNFVPSSRVVYQGDALVCEWNECRASFTDINEYITHLNEHLFSLSKNRIESGMFYCDWGILEKCRMEFKTKDSLKYHLQSHTGDKICACPFCGTFFCSKQKLVDHILRRQEGCDEFTCEFCSKKFKTQRLLENHCRRHIKAYNCPNCYVALNSSWELKRHIDSVHLKVRNHICEHCSRSFFQMSDLEKHQELHFRNLLFKCNLCDKKYRWEKQLKAHLKSHENNYISEPYICHFCSCRFKRGAKISKHLISVHGLAVPTGFLRFTYKKCSDGLFRLQTKQCVI